jgi:ESX secretion-associated protein EspG
VPDLTTDRCELSVIEFDVVWRGLGLGPPPVVLDLPSPGRTFAERRRLEATVRVGLRCHGPALNRLLRLLRLLAETATRVELRMWGAAAARAVAVCSGAGCVLARRHGDTVTLKTSTSLPSALVELLPPSRAGPGRTATVPTADLAAALENASGAGLRADLVERGIPAVEAGLLAHMLNRVECRVQVVALVGGSREVLDVLDGAGGQYLMTRSCADDGTGWTTVTPVDARRLRHRIATLLDGADDRADDDRDVSPGLRGASTAAPTR